MAWRDYVYRSFDTAKRVAATRRSRVVLALSTRIEPVAIDEIRGLSPSLADDYARRNRKTLTRDLHELIRMGLVTDEGGRYREARERILAFLPWRKGSG